MNRLLAIPRLLRLPNLVVVFLTQWLPYWFVLRPAILKAGAIPLLTERTFGLLAINTLLVTLGGYVINDYFDKDIDAINKPRTAIAGKVIAPGILIILYWIILAASALLSLKLFLELPKPRAFWPLWVFPVVSAGLFLYAWVLKCTPIIGNLLVALLCGIVPVVLLVPEDRSLWLASFQDPAGIHQATGITWLYAIFAFVTNFFREQIKDLEDFKGDAECGCTTLAVTKGLRFAKTPAVATGLSGAVLIGILIQYWRQTDAPDWQVSAGWILLFVPTLCASAVVTFGKQRSHFSLASLLLKIVMLCGVFLLLRSWPDDLWLFAFASQDVVLPQ